MDQAPVSPHSFVLEEVEDNARPLPYSLGTRKVKKLDYYPKYRHEFFDVVKICAEYIDKLNADVSVKISYSNRLNKIFTERSTPLVMRLFRELINAKMKEVNSHGQKNSS